VAGGFDALLALLREEVRGWWLTGWLADSPYGLSFVLSLPAERALPVPVLLTPLAENYHQNWETEISERLRKYNNKINPPSHPHPAGPPSGCAGCSGCMAGAGRCLVGVAAVHLLLRCNVAWAGSPKLLFHCSAIKHVNSKLQLKS
jgi:hypothetical protein